MKTTNIGKLFFFLTVILLTASITTSLFAQGSRNKGGDTSGGGTTGSNPLPQTPPAPNVIMRESFGQGPQLLRPASGNGTLKSTATGGTSFNGFWLEYLGSKNYRWTTIDSGITWRFCGTGPNPYELPSPLQTVFGFEQNTIICTLLNAETIAPAVSPTILMNMPTNLTTPYEIEIDGTYHPIPGTYLALGLTNSAATSGNLANSGNIVLVIKGDQNSVAYEFRLGGFNGQLLASGTGEDFYFNQLKIRYNPQTRVIGGSYNGVDFGNFQTDIAPSKYVAIEGHGYADNFVVRAIQ
jgi:hypothetical protein